MGWDGMGWNGVGGGGKILGPTRVRDFHRVSQTSQKHGHGLKTLSQSAMESWSNGREQLLKELTKVCDKIGNNIQTELDNDKFTRVAKEELDELRQIRDRHGLLVERYGNLGDELSRYKATAERVDGLEKENNRLAAELQQQLRTRQDAASTPRPQLLQGDISKSTPRPSEPPSSASRIDGDATQPVPLERYQSQVLKYNKLYEQHQLVKEARQILADRVRAVLEQAKEWPAHQEEQEKSIAKKNEKIKRLEAEVQSLRSQVQGEARGLEGNAPPKTGPASSLLSESAKESFQEGLEVEVSLSSPVKKAARATDDDILLYYDRAFEERAEAGLEEVELPRHPFNPIEETQFVALEAPHTSSTEGDTDPISSPRATNQDTPELLARRSPPETPVVISSRRAKKRKNQHETAQATPVSKVKVEAITSSPIGLATFFPLHESLDLDDIGEKVDTPRKQRRFNRELSRRFSQGLPQPETTNNADENQGHSRSNLSHDTNHTTASKNSPDRRTNSVLRPLSTNRQLSSKATEKRESKKPRIASDKDVDTLMEDGEFAQATPVRGGKQDSDRLNDLLSNPSPPKQALSPVGRSGQPARPRRSMATSGLAHEVIRASPPEPPNNFSRAPRITGNAVSQALSKDTRDNNVRSTTLSRPSPKGCVATQFESSQPSSRDTSGTSVEPQRPISRRSKRSSIELDVKTESRTSAESPPQAPNAPGQPSQLAGVPLPPLRDLQAIFTPKPHLRAQEPLSIPKSKLGSITRSNFGMESASKTKLEQIGVGTTSATRLRRRKSGNMAAEEWERGPDQEPLRARPLEKLRLSDFKANPNYNQGHQHPYRETARGGERQHLAGCQKECCRPKFRAMAEITTTENPTPSQEDRDEELLVKHMGDNAYKLESMTRQQRHELLLEAKTRDFSNALGRHRATYTRMTSPPGFWRTGFPTTQEARDDQEEARKRDRDEVAQRYDEAMRPGGRFLFRDE
ncbi:SAE2-domain-containing protein [Acephala macrosclerotiorum]|nr:SAE2-domain-containing protein [Acephala macrosclerotiorum]